MSTFRSVCTKFFNDMVSLIIQIFFFVYYQCEKKTIFQIDTCETVDLAIPLVDNSIDEIGDILGATIRELVIVW